MCESPADTGFYYLKSRYYDPAICRFINADGLASTGQGFLGANMFAYCNNNPVNRDDPNGLVSLWYYLFVDSDFGFIHRLVQNACVAQVPGAQKEVGVHRANGKYGRADIVYEGKVWEVKTTNSKYLALPQALSYIGGRTNETLISGLGDAGKFRGSFIVNCLYSSYIVRYCTPIPGVVLYDVKELNAFEPSAALSYVPKSEKEFANEPEPVPIFVLPPIGVPAFGGGPMLGGRDNVLLPMTR